CNWPWVLPLVLALLSSSQVHLLPPKFRWVTLLDAEIDSTVLTYCALNLFIAEKGQWNKCKAHKGTTSQQNIGVPINYGGNKQDVSSALGAAMEHIGEENECDITLLFSKIIKDMFV
ncbi:hypothetical protein C5167_012062, partial [Papaver somniferum]